MATNGRADRKYCAILLLMLSTSCALAQSAPGTDSPSTAELKRLVAADPAFKRLLIASIERANKSIPIRSRTRHSRSSSTTNSFRGQSGHCRATLPR